MYRNKIMDTYDKPLIANIKSCWIIGKLICYYDK